MKYCECKGHLIAGSFLMAFVVLFSCNSVTTDDKFAGENKRDTVESSKLSPNADTSKSSLPLFNDIDGIRSKLSNVGIGELKEWRDDQIGGYMSITNYYQLGDELPPNNLAYYLLSDNINYIREVQLVLNINNQQRKSALNTLANVAKKTYAALNLPVESRILTAIKSGREIEIEKSTYIEKVILQKSNIESWQLIIISK
ncbi:MAG: hypothetical protein H7Y42_14010 [Chitinophagaceae bacterium]|nr:hypothetical protein [Chitinophagaceae bacterium]